MVDLTPEFTDIRDTVRIERDGTTAREKRVSFYLGKFGPFVEYFDAATFSDGLLRGRVEALAQTLRAVHS